MKGTAYGVGVGPGDPELMTLKAARLIRENRVIAVPVGGSPADPRTSTAYRIAEQAVPELAEKEILALAMPMIMDREKLRVLHEKAAQQIAARLDQGENVVFLTLGDPAIYCTFTYLQEILEKEGYETKLVSGVPSFCAAAARLNIPLVKGSEPLHVLPGVGPLSSDGTCVIMKSGSHLAQIRQMLGDSGRDVKAVMNCGMEEEKVFQSAEELPEEGGYFTLIIAR